MRELVRTYLGPYYRQTFKQAENNHRLAHACGTARMGKAIENSVVDFSGRVHEVENLYVVDASVFPSSLGTNPSLMIAAHALRTVERALGHV
ncbi:GMC family oxidoreductase [bacterium]|nr:GMC family oxidoreductase [bacterium]